MTNTSKTFWFCSSNRQSGCLQDWQPRSVVLAKTARHQITSVNFKCSDNLSSLRQYKHGVFLFRHTARMDDDADAKKILTASPLEEIRWWSLDYLDEDSHIWPQVPRAHVDSSSQRGSHSGVCWLRVVQERNNDENDDQGDLIQTTWNSLTLPWWFAALLCGTRHVTCYWYQRYWRSRLAISAKLKLYNTCILPIFLYGTDCWAISKTDVCKIDALDQWCLRMLLGIKWYQLFRNDDVCRLRDKNWVNITV